jgi:hypothetical protein
MKPDSVAGTQLLAASRATLTVRLPDGRVRTLALSREPLTIGRHPTITWWSMFLPFRRARYP